MEVSDPGTPATSGNRTPATGTKPRRRGPGRRWIVAMVVAAVLVLGAAVTALAAPPIAAVACPQCYGLTALGNGVYAEHDDDRFRRIVAVAEGRIGAFYGESTTDARVLICATSDCYRGIGGGGEKGRAFGRWALMLSPDGANETIATHELAHLELHQRLGSAYGAVPDWFDEGLAVVIAGDARHLRPVSETDRCRLPWAEAATVVGTDWKTATAGGSDRGYLQAACVVSRWLTERGGPPAVRTLIDGLRDGKSFTEVG